MFQPCYTPVFAASAARQEVTGCASLWSAHPGGGGTRDAETPEPGPGEVRVLTKVVGISGSEPARTDRRAPVHHPAVRARARGGGRRRRNRATADRSRDRWTGTITVGWKPDGRRDRITVRGKTKTEVKDKLRTKHTELAAGIRTPANYTVELYLKDWLETVNTQAKSTLTCYQIMARHLIDLIGNVKLGELKVRDVDFALGKLAKRLSSVRLARDDPDPGRRDRLSRKL
jgi:hypothetical protein